MNRFQFRYNLGNGALILTSLEKITLNEYHKVSAKRYHRDGILSVDEMEDVAGQSSGHLKALDLAEDTYVGSVPSNFSKYVCYLTYYYVHTFCSASTIGNSFIILLSFIKTNQTQYCYISNIFVQGFR